MNVLRQTDRSRRTDTEKQMDRHKETDGQTARERVREACDQ